MSLRKQAKILGISHSYLTLMINGERPWNAEICERYEELVNTQENKITPISEGDKSNYLALAGARGSRTHHTSRRTAANGFEVRGDHQASSAPMSHIIVTQLELRRVSSGLSTLGQPQ